MTTTELTPEEQEMAKEIDGVARYLPPTYDRDGNKISYGTAMALWNRNRDDFDAWYGRVAYDIVGLIEISTVWLPIDHGLGRGPRQIFETMVFARPDEAGRDEDRFTTRYADIEAARQGHQRILRLATELPTEQFFEALNA